jgi:hypothetical protein
MTIDELSHDATPDVVAHYRVALAAVAARDRQRRNRGRRRIRWVVGVTLAALVAVAPAYALVSGWFTAPTAPGPGAPPTPSSAAPDPALVAAVPLLRRASQPSDRTQAASDAVRALGPLDGINPDYIRFAGSTPYGGQAYLVTVASDDRVAAAGDPAPPPDRALVATRACLTSNDDAFDAVHVCAGADAIRAGKAIEAVGTPTGGPVADRLAELGTAEELRTGMTLNALAPPGATAARVPLSDGTVATLPVTNGVVIAHLNAEPTEIRLDALQWLAEDGSVVG